MTVNIIGVEHNIGAIWTKWRSIVLFNILVSLKHSHGTVSTKKASKRTDFHRKLESLSVSKSCRSFETLERYNKSIGSSRLKISRRMSSGMSFINFEFILWFDWSAIALSFNSFFSLEIFRFFDVREPCAFVVVYRDIRLVRDIIDVPVLLSALLPWQLPLPLR